jgi:hypothetical protein
MKNSWKFSKIVKQKNRIFDYWVGVTHTWLGTPLKMSKKVIDDEMRVIRILFDLLLI